MYEFPDDSDSPTGFAFLDDLWAGRIRRPPAFQGTIDSGRPEPDPGDIPADERDAHLAEIVAWRREERDFKEDA